MKIATILLTSLLFVSSAFAVDGQQNWRGSGAEFSADGQPKGTYDIATRVMEVSPGVTSSETLITLSDGRILTIIMKISVRDNTFAIESTLGKGEGACYGEGLCESYINAGGGRAYATTIIQDGPNSRRHLTIELMNGKAVRMLREKVVRVN